MSNNPTELEEAARALVAKLDECRPAIVALTEFAHAHHYSYDGPTYGVELEALRAALAPDTVDGAASGEKGL